MTEHRATCQCGNMTATAKADPDFVIACNCIACQRRSGSPFGTVAYFRKSDTTTDGERVEYSRTADSGRQLRHYFCPTCGTTLYWELDMRPDHIGVVLGCFVTPPPRPHRVVWVEQQHDWVSFPDEWEKLQQGSAPPTDS